MRRYPVDIGYYHSPFFGSLSSHLGRVPPACTSQQPAFLRALFLVALALAQDPRKDAPLDSNRHQDKEEEEVDESLAGRKEVVRRLLTQVRTTAQQVAHAGPLQYSVQCD